MRIAIYVNDHPPPHVHVLAGAKAAVFRLNCPSGPPTLRENRGLKASELRIAFRYIAERDALCHEWEAIHGTE